MVKYVLALSIVIAPGSFVIDKDGAAICVRGDFAEAIDCSTLGDSTHVFNPRPPGTAPRYRSVVDNYCRRP